MTSRFALPFALRLTALTGLAVLAAAASLAIGARDVPLAAVWLALTAYAPGDADQDVVRGLRLARTLTGIGIGAALAMAGVVMQALTRNPLADPGLTGVNAGAALAVVALIWAFGPQPPLMLAGAAMAGAAMAAVAVWQLAGGRATGNGPSMALRLPLAGVAITSFCLSLVAAVVLLNAETRDLYRFWVVGSLAGADMAALRSLAPLICGGIILAMLVARGLDALALGADLGAGLGVRPGAVQAGALLAVVLASGAAVALAGPLGFVGLIVPHLARPAAGRSATLTVLVCALPMGVALVLACDTLGRIAARPSEVALGIMLALIGGPGFILLLHRLLGPRT